MTTDPGPLLVEQSGAVVRLTLNRPSQRNALSPELVCRLADEWQRIEDDDSVRAVILTGAGHAFCSGADLHLLVPLWSGTRPATNEPERRVLDGRTSDRGLLREPPCKKPVIAAVNGPAVAGGLEMMLGTDIRVAAERAVFGLAEAKRGLLPGGGGISRLTRQVPRSRALEMLLTGELVSADTAYAMGLVNHVVPADELLPTAERLAATIAANGPLAVRIIKEAVDAVEGLSREAALAIEAAAFHRVAQSNDAVEGALAFVEKRAPLFSGT